MKNKTIGVTLLDNPSKTSEPTADHDPLDGVVVAAAYAEIFKDVVTHTALTVGGVAAAYKIIERICK